MNKALFCQLHDHCQSFTPKIGRNKIIDKIKALAGDAPLITIREPLDINITRGFFLSASNTEHRFVKTNGRNVIVIARELNECWERFVNVKEAMHLLDDDSELTGDADKFTQLLSEFATPQPEPSPQRFSDLAGIWAALACFCPEESREKYKALLDSSQIDHYGIALQLKIPELYVPLLFRPSYERLLRLLRGD